jgi:hypothetical protein
VGVALDCVRTGSITNAAQLLFESGLISRKPTKAAMQAARKLINRHFHTERFVEGSRAPWSTYLKAAALLKPARRQRR